MNERHMAVRGDRRFGEGGGDLRLLLSSEYPCAPFLHGAVRAQSPCSAKTPQGPFHLFEETVTQESTQGVSALAAITGVNGSAENYLHFY
jgi:hypothetical protein